MVKVTGDFFLYSCSENLSLDWDRSRMKDSLSYCQLPLILHEHTLWVWVTT